jgi:hypothetical protein
MGGKTTESPLVAPLYRRVEAAATTVTPILLWWMLGSVGMCAGMMDSFLLPAKSEWARVSIVATGYSVVWLFPLFFTAVSGAASNATYGMKLRELVFRDMHGAPISRWRHMKRVLVGFLCVPVLPVSIITCIRDANKRSIPDLLCGTIVCTTGLAVKKVSG